MYPILIVVAAVERRGRTASAAAVAAPPRNDERKITSELLQARDAQREPTLRHTATLQETMPHREPESENAARSTRQRRPERSSGPRASQCFAGYPTRPGVRLVRIRLRARS